MSAGAREGGLDEADFRRYVAAFNRGDFDGFGRFYAQDVDFHGRAGHFQGRDAVLSFYRRVKSRVRETLSIEDVSVDGGQLVADMVTELTALEDWPDFPTGALRRGETRRSENFIWYDVEDGRFTRIRSAHYRSGLTAAAPTPVIETPRESDGAARGTAPNERMSTDRFAAYIDAFNRNDEAAYGDYYADDVVLVIAGKHELHGREAIFDFYHAVKAQTRRTIEINRVFTTANRLVAELQSEFVALEDLPQFIAGPMRKGGRLYINTFVIYELRAGKFARIRSAEYRRIARPGPGGAC